MLLSEDGRHVWLGRGSDPSPDELDEAGSAMDRQGLAGWLAVHRGDYWSPVHEPELMVVRRLTQREGDQGRASEMWRWLRRGKLSGFPASDSKG